MKRILALTLGICFCLAGAAWPLSVTVSKPAGGGTYTTVQAGINAAGLMGTVTILDSTTYTEDLVITLAQAYVTIQANVGQTPVIEAANAVNRYGGLGIVSPADRFGIAVQAPCTFIGLRIKNSSPQVNQHATMGPLAASAIIVNSPDVALRNCKIIGPGVPSIPGGDWVGCLVVALSATPASASLERCEVYGAEYGVVPSTFQAAMPGLPDSLVRMTTCSIHNCLEAGYQSDAGNTTLINSQFYSNQGTGVEIGGGPALLKGCDITDNQGPGLDLDWDSGYNAGRTNWPQVRATDCVIARNGTGARGVEIDDGLLTIDHSILSQNGGGGILMQNGSPTTGTLNMDFCDIYAPGKTCVGFDGPGSSRTVASIKNSILYGNNGVMCQSPHRANACFSDVWVLAGGTSFQSTSTSNTVTIEPRYNAPLSGTRIGFAYYNTDLNVGVGGSEIGSQGHSGHPEVAGSRRWARYP
jgi:hypothetical protein